MHPYVECIADIIESNAPYEKKLKEIAFYLDAIEQINESNKTIEKALIKRLSLAGFASPQNNISISLDELYRDPAVTYDKHYVTVLVKSAEKGYAEIVAMLCAAGANVEACNHDRYGAGYTPLISAAAAGHAEAVKTLIKHNADINASTSYQGYTALMLAARRSHTEVARVLIKAGASLSAVSHHLEDGCYENLTALDFAKENGCDAIVSLLSSPPAQKPLTEEKQNTPTATKLSMFQKNLSPLKISEEKQKEIESSPVSPWTSSPYSGYWSN